VHGTHDTAANESDVAPTHEVLHGQGDHVFLDAGYASGPGSVLSRLSTRSPSAHGQMIEFTSLRTGMIRRTCCRMVGRKYKNRSGELERFPRTTMIKALELVDFYDRRRGDSN